MHALPRLTLFAVVVAGLVSAARSSQAAEPFRRPNILLAVADDWSYPHAGVYGCSWVRTPTFDRIAHEGVLFTRAYTPNAKCSPSRAALLTGRNSWQLGAGATHYNFFPPEFRTFPEALAASGYITGYTGKGWSPGIIRHVDGSPRSLLGRLFDDRKAPPPVRFIANNDYAANFSDFLDAADSDGTPWFFWYGSNEPHRAYDHGAAERVGDRQPSEIDRVPGYWPDTSAVRTDMLDYAFEVEHFDRHLGRMLAELERSGQLENTIVVVTGDNGMPFPRAKGMAYEISVHVPLAVRWPGGVPHAGRTVSDYVSFVDLAPTFIAAAQLDWETTGLAPTPGLPLQPVLASRVSGHVDASRDHVLLGQERHDPGRPHNAGYPIRGLVQDNWLYLYNFTPDRWPASNPETGYLNTDSGATKTAILARNRVSPGDTHWQLSFGRHPLEELYDLSSDPDCLHNVVTRPDQAARARAMQDRLFTRLRAQDDPRMRGEGASFDLHPFAKPELNDFYEKWGRGEAESPSWVEPTDYDDPVPDRRH